MFGIFHRAIEELARVHGGGDCWEVIKRRAGVTAPTFQLFVDYPDEVFFHLAGATAEILHQSIDEFLFELGMFWVGYTREVGFDFVIDQHASLDSFLTSLEIMHARLATTMPAMQPPEMRVTKIGEGQWQLRYRSSRGGLAPFVLGALRGAGRCFPDADQGRAVSLSHGQRWMR